MYTSVTVPRELTRPIKALLLCWIAACVLLGVANRAVALSDNFNDGSINPFLWVTHGYKGGIGGVGAGSWQYSLTEVPATDGYLQARVWGPTSGLTYGAEAWARTTTNFNDGRPWLINFVWDTSVSAWHVDNFAVQIADGTNTDTCNWHQYAQNNVGPGWVNLWETGSTRSGGDYLDSDQPYAPFSKQTWSVKIEPVGTASIYQSANAQGAAYRQVSLDKDKPWYLRYLLNDATSLGFPGGDNSFKLYDFSAEGQIAPPGKTHVLSVGVRYNNSPSYKTLANDILAQRIHDSFAWFPSVQTNTVLVLDANNSGNRARIQASIESMGNVISAGDTFVFYIGSHGCLNWTGDEVSIDTQYYDSNMQINRAPSTADERVHLTRTAAINSDEQLSDDWLREMFFDPKWEQVNKLFLIDSCFAGGFWGTTGTGDSGDLATLSKAALIASSLEGDFSYTADDGPSGMTMNVFGLALYQSLYNLRYNTSVTYQNLYDELARAGSLFKGQNGRIADEDYWDVVVPIDCRIAGAYTSDFEMTLQGSAIPEPVTMIGLILSLVSAGTYARRRMVKEVV